MNSSQFAKKPIIFTLVLSFLAIALLSSNSSATIEVKANLSNANVEQVYAIAKSPLGALLTIQMKLNNQTQLFEGKSATKEAGNYNVTIFAIQTISGKLVKTNSTFAKPIYVDDCSTDTNCKSIGSNYLCSPSKKCEVCKCGLDNKCNSCCAKVKIEDFDCKAQTAEKQQDIILQVDASERGTLKIIAFEKVAQALEVIAEKGDTISEVKKVTGLTTTIPASNLSISIQLPSGKVINTTTDETGYVKIPIGKEESGNIIIKAGKTGKVAAEVAVEVKGISKGLVAAKEAAIATANVAAVPAAAIGGWALISFLSQLGIIFQSLLTAQISMSKAQVGRLKGAVQLIMLSFLLFSLRKMFGLLNLTQLDGINFELTYAILEIIFFVVFLIGILDLNSSMKELTDQNERQKKAKA